MTRPKGLTFLVNNSNNTKWLDAPRWKSV